MEAMYIPYSHRNKDLPDVYTYNHFPNEFKNQVIHLWTNTFEEFTKETREPLEALYKSVNSWIAEEHGLRELPAQFNNTNQKDLEWYFVSLRKVEHVLDVIELLFRSIIKVGKENPFLGLTTREAVNKLNFRFQQHGLGYRFENGIIIRVDSEHLHQEAIKPTVLLLQKEEFKGANDEFMNAFEHYRHGRHKECIAEAGKALESTLKTICFLRNWEYNFQKDTAKALISKIFANELIPIYLQDHYHGLVKVIEAGVPTLRNKTSAHGGGPQPEEVPEYMVSYTLNLTASTIRFLVEAHANKE